MMHLNTTLRTNELNNHSFDGPPLSKKSIGTLATGFPLAKAFGNNGETRNLGFTYAEGLPMLGSSLFRNSD